MAPTKHTQCDWIAVAGRVEVEDDDVADICSCYTGDFDQSHLGRSPEEEWANARLCASAPALLNALKHAVHWFDQLTRADIDRIQSVIDRAEGRT